MTKYTFVLIFTGIMVLVVALSIASYIKSHSALGNTSSTGANITPTQEVASPSVSLTPLETPKVSASITRTISGTIRFSGKLVKKTNVADGSMGTIRLGYRDVPITSRYDVEVLKSLQ